MGLSVTYETKPDISDTKTADLSSPKSTLKETYTAANLSDGTGDKKADRFWQKTITISAGATHKIDLASGGGGDTDVDTDDLGRSMNLSRVKLVHVRNKSTVDGGTVVIGGSGDANAWTNFHDGADGKAEVAASGESLFTAPKSTAWPVASGNKILALVNTDGANSVDVDVILVGATA